MQRNIYLDLDGVMADYEGYFLKIFGFKHNSVSDTVMWELINNHDQYFFNLDPLEGALDFFDYIKNLNPIVLTACPKTNYKTAAIQKRLWVHKHLGKNIWVLPVLGGKNKALFMHQPGDILIDDFDPNIKSWNANGGTGILHRNFKETKEKIDEYLD